VVEVTHLGSNLIFNMCVVFTANYSFGERRCPRRQRCILGDRLREYKDQSRVSLSEVLIELGCVCVFIRVDVHTCMSIYVCTVFLKKQYFVGIS
jgi:hypothetical protein